MAYSPFSKRAKALRAARRSGDYAPPPKAAPKSSEPETPTARLMCCAIQRDGVLYQGHQSHYALRSSLGWPNPRVGLPTDTEGFMDSDGMFLSREEARWTGMAAGQISRQWTEVRRPLLSSDIRW